MLPQWSVEINGSLFTKLLVRLSMKTAASKRNYLLSIEFFSLSLITKLLENSTLKTPQTRNKT